MGQGDGAGVPHHPRLMLLCSSYILSVHVTAVQRAGSGGRGTCQAPADVQQQLVVEQQLLAALLHHCGAGYARTAHRKPRNAASLCDPTTRAECLAWSCFLGGYGAAVSVCGSCCTLLQLCLFGRLSLVEESRGKKVHKERCAGLLLSCLHVMLGRIL